MNINRNWNLSICRNRFLSKYVDSHAVFAVVVGFASQQLLAWTSEIMLVKKLVVEIGKFYIGP
jgi:hypothetical protein